MEITENPNIDEVHTFLTNHYIRGDNSALQYSREFLKWYVRDTIAVRQHGQIIGFVSTKLVGQTIEIDFLCVHSDHRHKNVARDIKKANRYYVGKSSNIHN